MDFEKVKKRFLEFEKEQGEKAFVKITDFLEKIKKVMPKIVKNLRKISPFEKIVEKVQGE